VLEMLEPLAREKHLTFKVEASREQFNVLCDWQRVLQVFANLIGNAMKFTPAGGCITTRTELHDGVAMFSVTDTGAGIPADSQARVFERHFQAEHEAHKGSGLGLYIARGIVEAHGGRIWVDSKIGSGTTFWFTLPLGSSSVRQSGVREAGTAPS
jgi:signal transduction histidine kinase